MPSMRCSACGTDVPAESQFCARCGANLAASAVVTAAPDRGASPSTAPTDGRFPVGIVLGERYRILGLLGRGGMGEVYRAHDLKLEQQVALKFLPGAAAFNPSLMERFRGEVRIARQIWSVTSYGPMRVPEARPMSADYSDTGLRASGVGRRASELGP